MTRYFHSDEEIAAHIGSNADDVFTKREELGLSFPVARTDAKRIQSRLEANERARLSSFQKAILQSRREAEERVGQHSDLIERAREDLFGKKDARFNSYPEASEWLEKETEALPEEEPTATPRPILVWIDAGTYAARRCAVPMPEAKDLARLANWASQLATAAAIHEGQATAAILSDEIFATEEPVRVEATFQRGKQNPKIRVTAEPYVRKKDVAEAYSEVAGRMTGRKRQRPAPKRPG